MVYCVMDNGWMISRFYIIFNSILVISEWWEGDYNIEGSVQQSAILATSQQNQ